MLKKLSFVIFLLITVNSFASIIYVKHDASGSNNGTSWTNAYVLLQSALDAAVSGDQIWVSKGTYLPTKKVGGTGERYRTYQMKNGVGIYGGFTGSETLLSQRDYVNISNLSSGDYNLILTCGNQSIMKKLVVVK